MKKILLLVLVISMMSVTSELDKDYVKQVFSETMNEEITEEKAMEILKNAFSVDDEATGDAGSVSEQRNAYNKISNSEELLVKLFNESKTMEVKVYALMGLKSLNSEFYKKYYNQIDIEAHIRVFTGCLMFSEKIGDYLKKTDYFNKLNN